MQLTIEVENLYEDGEQIDVTKTVVVEAPDRLDDDALEEWAYDELYAFTGTGRFTGNEEGLERTPDAVYTVTIKACEENPELVGREFEFGT